VGALAFWTVRLLSQAHWYLPEFAMPQRAAVSGVATSPLDRNDPVSSAQLHWIVDHE
jgi:hypothetical protein